MSEFLNETRVSFSNLAQEQSIHVSTVWRWALRGIRGNRLECFTLGGRRYTTREAFARFVAATNGTSGSAPPPENSPDPESALEKAERDLDEILMRKNQRDSEDGTAAQTAPQ